MLKIVFLGDTYVSVCAFSQFAPPCMHNRQMGKTYLSSSSSPNHSLKLIAPQHAVGCIVNYCLCLLHLRHHIGLENSLQTDGELLEMNLQVCEKMDTDSDGLLIFNNVLEKKDISTWV